MINIIKRYKNSLIVVAVVLVAFVVYGIFFTPDRSNPLTVERTVRAGQSAVEQELIGLLLELRSITLDTDVFDDARFRSLEDFSQQIVAEPVGRENPFAPIGQ